LPRRIALWLAEWSVTRPTAAEAETFGPTAAVRPADDASAGPAPLPHPLAKDVAMIDKVVRLTLIALVVLGLTAAGAIAQSGKTDETPQPPEITDPEQVQADPDFAVQGEYLGRQADRPVGAQVIALGRGEFHVVLYPGGLPGRGWKRGDARQFLHGKRDGETTQLSGDDATGSIVRGRMTVDFSNPPPWHLERAERKSPTLGLKPPADAVVLFDGSGDGNFTPPGHLTADRCLLAGTTTQQGFDGDYQLHLEFRLSWLPEARAQDRSNSGVYLRDCYEVQVLDSFGLEGNSNECGGFYEVKHPDVNMCLPPMSWQTYDIDFTAPKYEGNKKVAHARVTVRHNGVLIHDDLDLPRETPGRQAEGPGSRPIHLQGHNNKVYFRNIWLQKK
jgi:hypothetical protein